MSRVEYQEYPVPAELRRHFACVWRLRDAQPPAGVQTIYPDGRCELIAILAGRSRLWDAVMGWHDQAGTLFAAQRVTAVQLEASGAIDDVGIRVQPAASALLARNLAPLRDRVVDLSGLDADVSRELSRAAREFVAGKPGALWALLQRLAGRQPLDEKIEATVARIETSGGATRIDTLARAAGWGVRRPEWRTPLACRVAIRGDIAFSPSIFHFI